MNTLPYSDIFCDLLVQIHKGIGYCHTQFSSGKELSEEDERLNGLFSSFESKYRVSGLNKHLTKGLNKTIQKRKNIFPRLSKLIVDGYVQAQATKKGSHYKAEIIPSPLNILYHALTIPEEPQTSAYAFVLCRGMLFYFLNLHPRHPELDTISPDFDAIREEDILKSISTFNSHIDVQIRWPDPRTNHELLSARINYLNGHILSTKGITYLWFNNTKQLLKFCSKVDENDTLLSFKKLYSNQVVEKEKYSFRLTNTFTDLPDASEIINWIFGLPIPLRGADVLFYGGLKKSSNAGLVMSIHGQPGVGKTSAALSLSAVLSPLQTKTVYISLEEEPEDLKTRLSTLIPDYLKWLSIFENNYYNERIKPSINNDPKWFSAFKIRKNLDIGQLTNTLELLKKDLKLFKYDVNYASITKSSLDDCTEVSIPAVAPLLLVIDNVNELFTGRESDSKNYERIGIFIEQCRSMGAIVVLIAADDIPGIFKLDYLVDVSIHLSQEGLDKKYEKPIRILQLVKTRYQVSRQGSHVFHLSNSKGFRISPQVPSQMDKREKLKIQLPSKNEFIHSLNWISNKGYHYNDYLSIASQSQILVHGNGSSGKAGFGMKLLLTPLQHEITKANFDDIFLIDKRVGKPSGRVNIKSIRKNKVLVVSFLYPIEYYLELHQRLQKQFERYIFNYNSKNSIVNVKAFYPGYLTAEDYVYKIVRILEEAKLEGEPYTGILLDGLHNVFLQFKNLQEAHMIWPLLYSILSRYNLTVVTTFTNFSLGERHSNYAESDKTQLFQTPDDFTLMQEGQKPFLHGLVKAADYYFLLEEVINDEKNYQREYWLSVKSSIRRIPPKDYLKWDRDTLVFTEIIPGEKIYGSRNKLSSDLFPDGIVETLTREIKQKISKERD